MSGPNPFATNAITGEMKDGNLVITMRPKNLRDGGQTPPAVYTISPEGKVLGQDGKPLDTSDRSRPGATGFSNAYRAMGIQGNILNILANEDFVKTLNISPQALQTLQANITANRAENFEAVRQRDEMYRQEWAKRPAPG